MKNKNENIQTSNNENFTENLAIASMLFALSEYLVNMQEANKYKSKVLFGFLSSQARKAYQAVSISKRRYLVSLNDAIACIYQRNRHEITNMRLEEKTKFIFSDLTNSVSEYAKNNHQVGVAYSYFNFLNENDPKTIFNNIRQIILEIEK